MRSEDWVFPTKLNQSIKVKLEFQSAWLWCLHTVWYPHYAVGYTSKPRITHGHSIPCRRFTIGQIKLTWFGYNASRMPVNLVNKQPMNLNKRPSSRENKTKRKRLNLTERKKIDLFKSEGNNSKWRNETKWTKTKETHTKKNKINNKSGLCQRVFV